MLWVLSCLLWICFYVNLIGMLLVVLLLIIVVMFWLVYNLLRIGSICGLLVLWCSILGMVDEKDVVLMMLMLCVVLLVLMMIGLIICKLMKVVICYMCVVIYGLILIGRNGSDCNVSVDCLWWWNLDGSVV